MPQPSGMDSETPFVEGAFAEFLGAHVGLGDPGADAPAIGEFARQRQRRTSSSPAR